MIDFRELSFAVARIILGIVVLIEGLIVLDIVVHITSIGSIFGDTVMAAYEDGYNDVSYEAGAMSGDHNLDGTLDILDIVYFVDVILNP